MLPGTARFDGMTLPPGRTIGVLSVHEARHALGQWLRELRQQAGLTGRQVADLLSWPASKASKLENGRQTPTDDDVRGWASVTHARCCRWACPSLDNRIGVLDNQECTLGEGVYLRSCGQLHRATTGRPHSFSRPSRPPAIASRESIQVQPARTRRRSAGYPHGCGT
jgi:hypothetical protein